MRENPVDYQRVALRLVRAWNALRLATALQQEVPGTQLRLFLLSDGVYSALPEHHRPEGGYDIGQMLASLIASARRCWRA